MRLEPWQHQCRSPIQAPGGDFVVLDVNWIHEVSVDFCGCKTSKPHFIQLLQYHWFPASVDCLKTAATMAVLKFFQLLNFESKASSFEFHSTLAHLTNNTGTPTHKVCKLPASHHIHSTYYSFRIDIAHFLSWSESTDTSKCWNGQWEGIAHVASWWLSWGNVQYCALHACSLVWTLKKAGRMFHQNRGVAEFDFVYFY